jgi:predicted nucleic acid-binding protein
MADRGRFVFDTNVIVSGDKDLQVLHPFRNIPILSPREFLETDF